MNSLERYHAMLDGKPCDFYPRTPILMQFAAHHIGRSYGEFTADHEVLVAANLACAEDFGMDQVSAISDPYRETSGFGGEIIIHDESGPECVTPPLAADLDVSVLAKPDPETDARMHDRLQAVRLFKEKVGGEKSILGWVEGPAAEAGDLRGVENFLMDLLEDPEGAAGLMDVCLETAQDFAIAQLEAGADMIGIGDALVSQVSPAVYEKWIWPRQRALVDAIRQAGGLVRLHICGSITHLLPGIAALPIQALDVDHMVDLAEVRRQVGSHILIGANLNPVADVKNGSPESIKNKLRKNLQEVGGRFAANAGCEIPPGTPPENLKALCEPIPYQS